MKEPGAVVRIPGSERAWELAVLETSPCTLACPTRINARGYVSLIADGRYAEALALIRERNPFPGVCGRICPRPCEAACRRGEFDEAIAICALKRFVFDVEMRRGVDPAVRGRISRRERVAVIGAGPAGLSAALDLARAGYPVTVFEAAAEPGGMMNVIPRFRLPERVVKREIAIILESGIELVTGCLFGRDVTWNALRRRGYRALLLATGAQRPAWRFPKRSDLHGLHHALDLLRSVSGSGLRTGSPDAVAGKRIAVVGDGMLALDAARSAVRLGARIVTLVTERSRKTALIPAVDLGIAAGEGVRFEFLTGTQKLVRSGKRLAGIGCVRLREEEADATGRGERSVCAGSDFTVEADIVLDALSRTIDTGSFSKEIPLSRTPADTAAVDRETMSSGQPGVFAAGDLVTGPRSVVEAIASGQKAARGIRSYLEGVRAAAPYEEGVAASRRRVELAFERLPAARAPRFAMPLADAKLRRGDFSEVERGFTGRTAQLEARRCLRCGLCAECTVCTDICEKKDIELSLEGGGTVTVHAEREFWSGDPSSVVLELDGATREVSVSRTVCRVDPAFCIGCGRCETACGYSAVRVQPFPGGRFVAAVNELACKGCGTCVAACPTGAMDQINFERERLRTIVETVEGEKTGVLLACRMARSETVVLPAGMRLVEVTCAGRITPSLIIGAVQAGCTGVMVCGCREERCRYGDGRKRGSKAVAEARAVLALLGYDPRIVAEASVDPGGFQEAVRSWAAKRNRKSGRHKGILEG